MHHAIKLWTITIIRACRGDHWSSVYFAQHATQRSSFLSLTAAKNVVHVVFCVVCVIDIECLHVLR